MAKYDHLTIFQKSYDLMIRVYKEVHNFSREYKYSLQTKNIYWGIEIPNPQKAGTYTGQINFTAIKNETPWP